MKACLLIVLAIYLILLYGCKSKEEVYFDTISENDIELSRPVIGEWLYEHKESRQSLEEYIAANPNIPSSKRNFIYLQPYGSFSDKQMEVLQRVRDYVAHFFQMQTVLLPIILDKNVPDSFIRNRGSYTQLLAPYILHNFLKPKVPQNAIAYMAFTSKDLYPNNEWNFVLGLASYRERVGVTSIWRIDTKDSNVDTNLFLKRLCNVASHEIGHMMSLKHCVHAQCVMNGSNSLSESDRSPNRLCSLCQRKLFWSHKYDNKKRMLGLLKFLRENHLEGDAYLLERDSLLLFR